MIQLYTYGPIKLLVSRDESKVFADSLAASDIIWEALANAARSDGNAAGSTDEWLGAPVPVLALPPASTPAPEESGK
jgi:hypothetical protein